MITGWTIYYEDGSVEEDIWNNKHGVVKLIVWGDVRTTQTKDGPVREHYVTMFYEDEDDAKILGNPQYWFWQEADGTIGAGYLVPPAASRKRAMDQAVRDLHEHIFGLREERIVSDP